MYPHLKEKADKLQSILTSYDKLLIAYSGGIDSSLLVAAAMRCLKENYLAVTFITPLQSKKEIEHARYLAKKLSLNYLEFKEDVLSYKEIKNNLPLRCYYCKKILFQKLIDFAELDNYYYIADGSNIDDEKNYRPGTIALKEMGIKSPLKEAGFTKKDIRELAKEWGLENYLRPASPCLASRFPYHTELTNEKLLQVEQGEEILSSFGISDYRLRHHGDLCRIEIPKTDWNKFFLVADQAILDLKKIGYTHITLDLAGLQSGVFDKYLISER